MDQISNFITGLKNAGNAGHESVAAPYSKLKTSICEVLKKEGFIKNFQTKTEKGKQMLIVNLLLENRIPRINGAERISKPSRRIYKKADEIRSVKSGYGALIVSTSAGIMTGREAKKAKLGGEALFTIW
ncbi:MAG: 30S ribosomal protein S8 [Candidatus Zambryskibacteria bacterium RIFCSPHIGHO2_01_FULL_49_18]|uniref:Small ribosomal subunit protein uS8 n=1 Tax=Candidatus Zambryskibacteria bacterium RIFCSPHIGHO2_01_FULL_49_18 TaxID=1802740 RepID=A0A1G2T4C5_9BACT|nr:MAG: 30S ribosomal protein S8 [Candidatus Zambryskibacteria bacterium RIFCSPHIGHO2_01_FULL_49_18]